MIARVLVYVDLFGEVARPDHREGFGDGDERSQFQCHALCPRPDHREGRGDGRRTIPVSRARTLATPCDDSERATSLPFGDAGRATLGFTIQIALAECDPFRSGLVLSRRSHVRST